MLAIDNKTQDLKIFHQVPISGNLYIITLILFFAGIICISFLVNEYLILVLGLGILFGIMLFGNFRKNLLYFIITTFLAVPATLGVEIRTTIQVGNIILLLLLFITVYFQRDFESYNDPKDVFYFIIAYLSVMLITSLFGNNFWLGITQLARQFVFFIITYLIYKQIENFSDVKILIGSIFILAVIFFTGITYLFVQSGFNIIELNLLLIDTQKYFANRNHYGAFFIIVLSMLFAFLFISKTATTSKRVYLTFFLLFLCLLIVTNSRAAVLAVFISFLFILYHTNRKWFNRSILISLSSFLFLVVPAVFNIVEEYFRLDALTSGRDLIFESVFNVVKENFLLGTGPAGTKLEIYKYIPFMLGSPEEFWINYHYNQIEYGHAHNFYLFFLSDMGIPGLVISIWLPALFFRYVNRLKKVLKEKKNSEYYLVLAIGGAGLGFFLRGLLEWGSILSYGAIFLDLPFWLMFIILIFLYRKNGLIYSSY